MKRNKLFNALTVHLSLNKKCGCKSKKKCSANKDIKSVKKETVGENK